MSDLVIREFQSKPNPSAREFVERSTVRGLMAISRDWIFILTVAGLSIFLDHWLAWLVAVLFIGVMQFSLAEAILHEAAHYNLFRSRRMHHWLQFLYAWPFLQTLGDYRAEHLNHHQHLMTDRDQTWIDYRLYGLNAKHPNVFYIWFIKPFTLFPTWFFLRHGNALLNRATWLPLGIFWGSVGGVFLVLGQIHLLLLYWFTPLLLVYPIVNYWSEIEEHYNALSGSRSNLNRMVNFLTHNEGYHSVHHKHPSIPFYNLPKAHRALTSDCGDVSFGFFDTYRQISIRRG